MTVRFTVLASGSSGNASLLETSRGGVLVDLGLNARQISLRLAARGYSWRSVHAAVLTHTHSDHWNESALNALVKHGVPLHCHLEHADYLALASKAFRLLQAAGRIQFYEPLGWYEPVPELRARPLPLSHDGGTTCGFRFEGPGNLFGPGWAIGYAADLGTWDEDLVGHLADVDLLAVEFNHDEVMQRTSGRPRLLIDRVLGDRGHLSNRQAAALLKACRERSVHDCLRIAVGLHPSRQCNRAELVLAAAQPILDETSVNFHLATHDKPTPVFEILARANGVKSVQTRRRRVTPAAVMDLFDGLPD